MNLTAHQLVDEARTRIREVAPQDFAADHRSAVLIDVREPAEFQTGHLADAINLPRGVLEFQIETHPAVAPAGDQAPPDKARPIVLYCRTGGRAALAAVSLQRMGFTDVSSISGGITGWSDAGLPVCTE